MKQFQTFAKVYGYITLYSGLTVFALDMHKYRKRRIYPELRHIDIIYDIADDLTKCLIWPVTGPPAIKHFIERLDFSPIEDNEYYYHKNKYVTVDEVQMISTKIDAQANTTHQLISSINEKADKISKT